MERKLLELMTQRLNLQGIVDVSTKELKHEVGKRQRIEYEVAKLEGLNVIGQLAAVFVYCANKSLPNWEANLKFIFLKLVAQCLTVPDLFLA
jgi:uncharacterized protein YybS (DUF2232 family)